MPKGEGKERALRRWAAVLVELRAPLILALLIALVLVVGDVNKVIDLLKSIFR